MKQSKFATIWLYKIIDNKADNNETNYKGNYSMEKNWYVYQKKHNHRQY